MEWIKKQYLWLFLGALIFFMVLAYFLTMSSEPARKQSSRVNDNNSPNPLCTSIKDTDGNILLKTGLPVHKDDEYISETDVHYVIITVNGSNAIAKVKENLNPTKKQSDPAESVLSIFDYSVPVQQQLGPGHFVIYHTHSDESYIPTSKTASKPGQGDIIAVGSTFKKALNKEGISVTHSTVPHDPHDINAYHRSRRTLTQLLKERPDAAFDLHRDSGPRESYLTTVNGIDTSRVMIVIGRSNPNMRLNIDYAEKIKAKADELYPGLMKGIFIGKGDYNQDLYPRALLFEVGTENVSLNLAQNAIRCVADTVTAVLRE